jgi:putative transposase
MAQQEFIMPHCPQQNSLVASIIRILKEQCVHRHRFETQNQASRNIGGWIQFYTHRRLHQAQHEAPPQAQALAAWPVQKPADH